MHPSVPSSPSRARQLTAHIRLYLRRRLITPFDANSEYRRLDRWLTFGLLFHWNWWRVGGYMTPFQARTITQFATDHNVRRIGQIGFLVGHFVCAALTIDPNLDVTSFDIGTHRHSRAADRWLNRHFPGRSRVIWGNSRTTVRDYAEKTGGGAYPFLDFGLIIVDGDHSYDGACADLDTVWRLAIPGTYVFMDDLGLPDGVAFDNGPARAWAEAMSDGRFEPIQQWTEPNGHTFAVGRVIEPVVPS